MIKQLLSTCMISLALVSSASFASEAPKKQMMKMPAPKADVFIVAQPQDLHVSLKYPAMVKAYNRVHVVSRVLGTLEKKHFIEGAKVNKGDLLYEIEDDIYAAKVEAANASVKLAQASLQNASRDWKRVQKLFKQKAVSQEKRDISLSNYEAALASLALAKAQLKTAKIDLGYTKVEAPIGGVAGMKLVDVGDLVNSGTKLLEITQNSKVYIEFSMPMSDYKKIKNHTFTIEDKGVMKVALQIDGKVLNKEGVVDFIDVNTNNQTSIVKMRALFDNSDKILMAGEFVRVITKNIVQKGVITVPQKAVLQNPLGTIVFVEENGHVGVRPIVPGDVSGDKFVVAGGAIKSGDKVIVNNFFRLKPGGAVVVDKIINK